MNNDEWVISSREHQVLSEALDHGFLPARKYRRPESWATESRKPLVTASAQEEGFLSKLYQHCAAADPEAALDLILDVFDEAIDAGDSALITELLQKVDLEKVDLAVALGFLSATTVMKLALPYRGEFWHRVAQRFLQERDAEETDRLLAPFR